MNEYRIQKLYRYICLEFKNQRQLIGKRKEEVAFDLSVTAGHLSRSGLCRMQLWLSSKQSYE